MGNIVGKVIKYIYFSIAFMLMMVKTVHAYLDPTVVTYVIQIIAGFAVGVGVFAGTYLKRILRKISPDVGKAQASENQEIIIRDGRNDKEEISRENLIVKRENKDHSFIYISLICLAFAFLAGVFSPYESYLTNASEMTFGKELLFPEVMKLFLILFGVGILVTFLLGFINKNCQKYFGIFLFGIFLVFYIQGTFLAGNLPPLDGTLPDWSAYMKENVISAVLILAVGLLLFYGVKKAGIQKTLKYAAAVSLTVVVMLGSALVNLNSSYSAPSASAEKVITSEHLFEMSKDRNFIILLVDAVDSATFQKMMNSEDPQFAKTLQDFTYYPDTVCAYPYTTVSIPFILSGQWFLNEQDFPDYVNQSLDQSPLFQSMEDNNYRIGVYDDTLSYNSEGINRFENYMAQKTVFSSFKDFAGAELEYFWFKYAPYPLKRFTDVSITQFQDILASDSSSELFSWKNRTFLDNLSQQGIQNTDGKSFKFIHLQGAHKPFEYDSQANYIEKAEGDYETNIEAAFFTVDEYLKALKKAGVYDNSVIVILADHGYENPADLPELARSNAFLAVKGIGEKHEMMISDLPVSYGDLQDCFKELLEGKQSSELFADAKEKNKKRRFILFSYQNEDHMYEYNQYGHASDYRLLVFSGNEYIRGE